MYSTSVLANQFKRACERHLQGNLDLYMRVIDEAGPEGFAGLIKDGFDEVFGMAEEFLGGGKQDLSGPQTRVAERYARIFLQIVSPNELVALTPQGFGDDGVAEAYERGGQTSLAEVSRLVRGLRFA